MDNTLKTIIVEDELSGSVTLRNMLERFCENIAVVAAVETVEDAIRAINKEQPDIIFLDIELPEKSGFELLNFYPKPNFDIIFTTAYDKYALKAFRFAATDYLLKPIDLEELRAAIQRSRKNKQDASQLLKFKVLIDNLDSKLHKLNLPTSDGFVIVEIGHIIRCEADGNYTKFHLIQDETHLIARTLKFYEDLLSDFNFYRINRSDMINLEHLKKFARHKKPQLIMCDGTILSLADSRKDEFLKKIKHV